MLRLRRVGYSDDLTSTIRLTIGNGVGLTVAGKLSRNQVMPYLGSLSSWDYLYGVHTTA